MTDQQFLQLAKRWIIGGISTIVGTVFITLFVFYSTAENRISDVEKKQNELLQIQASKLDKTEFLYYREVRDNVTNAIQEDLAEIKDDIKTIKNNL